MQKDQLKLETRRHFFRECGVGVGAMALGSMLGRSSTANDAASNPMTQARAKRVIYMFMAGGPSQLELFDHKPLLTELHGKPTPAEFMKDKRFAFLKCPRVFMKSMPFIFLSCRPGSFSNKRECTNPMHKLGPRGTKGR